VNGIPTGFENDGKTVRYGKDGITPMTLEEWIDMREQLLQGAEKRGNAPRPWRLSLPSA
jgi:hypothetical protein